MSILVRFSLFIVLFVIASPCGASFASKDHYNDPIKNFEEKKRRQNDPRSIEDIAREQYQQQKQNTYTRKEILKEGHDFFGQSVSNFASVLEEVFASDGRPVAYIMGEESSGALFLGLTYGQGVYQFKQGQKGQVFWQGPSIGFDAGLSLNKILVLVYNASGEQDLTNDFVGASGAIYYLAGFTISIRTWKNVKMVSVRLGVGLRLGFNVGYLKYRLNPAFSPI